MLCHIVLHSDYSVPYWDFHKDFWGEFFDMQNTN